MHYFGSFVARTFPLLSASTQTDTVSIGIKTDPVSDILPPINTPCLIELVIGYLLLQPELNLCSNYSLAVVVQNLFITSNLENDANKQKF